MKAIIMVLAYVCVKKQKATVCVPVSQTDVVFPSDILSIWLKKYWWHLFLKFVYKNARMTPIPMHGRLFFDHIQNCCHMKRHWSCSQYYVHKYCICSIFMPKKFNNSDAISDSYETKVDSAIYKFIFQNSKSSIQERRNGTKNFRV